MLPKNFAIGVGIVTLSLAALFGFACDDDDDDNGDTTIETPADVEDDDAGDETPTE